MVSSPSSPEATFSASLRAMDDHDLGRLFELRPDLLTPAPSTFLALAARAAGRSSLEHALAAIDTLHIQALEAVLVLESPVTEERVVHALGLDDSPDDAALVRKALTDLRALALIRDTGAPRHLRAAPGIEEILGPHPAGLGPHSADLPGGEELSALIAEASGPARQILNALTWGPPVGIAPVTGPGRQAADWLVEHGLLVRSGDRHLVLPGQVGLRLRGGRTHQGVQTAAPLPVTAVVPTESVDAEAALSALAMLRMVTRMIAMWRESPPNVMRAGGLAVRDLRLLAHELEASEQVAALVVEIALEAGLAADDGEGPSFAPTFLADEWQAADTAHKWVVLVEAWWSSRRTTWLVGSRDEKGHLRAAGHQDLWRSWVPTLRSSIISLLADARPHPADTRAILACLGWLTPRATPPPQAVSGLLREAELLGVTGAGILSGAGLALHRGEPLAPAFTAMLPAEVDELLLQGDLTGIVPGRPSDRLERLVAIAADTESHGAATTIRFTAESIVRALDMGYTADRLLADLAAHSPVGVPQPLEYLVRDTARRHGRIRVGAAYSYLRCDDPALVTGLARRADLAFLGLTVLAPTVLASQVPAVQLQSSLRERGVVSVIERPDGSLVVARPPRSRVSPRRHPGGSSVTDRTAARSAEVIAALRRQDAADIVGSDPAHDVVGEEDRDARAGVAAATGDTPQGRTSTASAGSQATVPAPSPAQRTTGTSSGKASVRRGRTRNETTGTSDPASALGILREAIADQAMVWLEMVGPDGRPDRRHVRPLTLEGGRLRARDPDRGAELTVIVHRIAGVERDG